MSIDSSFDTPEHFEEQSQKSPETLKTHRQRSGIGGLVDALEKGMSAGEAVDQVLGYGKNNGGEFFGNLGEHVKANPVAAVLTAVGALWLMSGKRTPSPGSSMLDRASDTVGAVAGSVANSIASAKARVQETAARMGEKASDLKDRSGQLASNVDHTRPDITSAHAERPSHDQGLSSQSSINGLLHDQPLIVAAIGIAVGALIGAALPTSEREKKLLAQAREKLIEERPAEPDQGGGSTPGSSMASLTASDDSQKGMEGSDIVGAEPGHSPSSGSAPRLG